MGSACPMKHHARNASSGGTNARRCGHVQATSKQLFNTKQASDLIFMNKNKGNIGCVRWLRVGNCKNFRQSSMWEPSKGVCVCPPPPACQTCSWPSSHGWACPSLRGPQQPKSMNARTALSPTHWRPPQHVGSEATPSRTLRGMRGGSRWSAW